MKAFPQWLTETVGTVQTPVFVEFNALFDWSFVNYSFHRYAGGNPFGFAALDIKALYLGRAGVGWRDTRSARIAERLRPSPSGDHDALYDALCQAELFRLIMDMEPAERRPPSGPCPR